MPPERLAAALLNNGIQLWVENNELCFRAPKGTLTPELREELLRNKNTVIAYLGTARKLAAATSAQQRLWFMDRLTAGQPIYNIPVLLHAHGSLDEALLKQSIGEIVRRHEALRTVFIEIAGQPYQVILPAQPISLVTQDLRDLEEDERDGRVQYLLQEEAHQPFNLSEGPLFRLLLIRETEEKASLLFTIHHIAFDGWSLGVFLNELGQLYAAYAQGAPSPLPPLANQVADFAYWQNQFLQGQTLERYLQFWKSLFSTPAPYLTLPSDHARPAIQTYAGGKCKRLLPLSLLEALTKLGREENASLFMVLLAALQVLLYRYSGQTDITIGTPLANRSQSKMEALIGFFVNSLPIRGDLSGNPTFRSVLKKAQIAALDVQTYQDLPLEKLVEALGVERSLSHHALFQVMLAVQNAPLEEISLPGLHIEHIEEYATGAAQFDLLMDVSVQKNFSVSIEYASDLFEEATVERMLGHFETLLEAVAADADQPIGRLPILTPLERQQLLYDWNRDEIDYPFRACMHSLFEAQVAAHPNATALIFGDEHITYQDLNQRANQLAHHLRSLGIRPETLVGVCMERTPELIVALLGVLKAGGAYVPLDPNYPAERMAFMLEDTCAPVLLTQQRLLSRLPEGQAHILFCLDRDWEIVASHDRHNPAPAALPDNLGYIIYTSGSTGRPKGVAIAHRNAVVMLTWAANVFPREGLAAVLAATSVCFDLSVYEIFLPLSVGGSIVLADNALHLPNLPARERVTLVNTVPSAMAELVRSRDLPPSVQIVNLAGEPLKRTLVQQIYARSRAHSVYNLYGPSEDTTYSTFARIDRSDPLEPSIGRPLSNTQAYLLDRSLQPVPLGNVGELYLGGAGVSRGYLRRPEQTAERYIPDPFSRQPGGRMYKTGDLARYRPDGRIEFLGRIDHQVKIRGFRIELGEIESALEHHPAIQDTVVVALPFSTDNQGAEEKRLVAYLVFKKGQSLSVEELRAYLKESLPEYMLPAVFMMMDALPLTPNGKVDRKALPAPLATLPTPSQLAPRTPTEESLVAIWAAVLNTPSLGIRDNFFNLGGHSLLATRILARVRETFGVEIPLRKFFETSTVEALAVEVETAQQSGAILVPEGFSDDMEAGRL